MDKPDEYEKKKNSFEDFVDCFLSRISIQIVLVWYQHAKDAKLWKMQEIAFQMKL